MSLSFKGKSQPQHNNSIQQPPIQSRDQSRVMPIRPMGAPFGAPIGLPPSPVGIYEVRERKPIPPPQVPGEGLKRAINYYADYAGCGWWRMIMPEILSCIENKAIINGLSTMIVDPRFYNGIQAVRLQRQATPVQLEFVKFLKEGSKKTGLKMIYEIDDVIFKDDIPDFNRCKVAFEDEKILQSSLEMMRLCDEMSVTCQFMKEYYMDKTGHKNITVIPNYPAKWWMDNHYWPEIISRNYEKNKERPRIAYIGSGTHIDVTNRTNQVDDFHHVVNEIIKSRKQFKWVFVGAFPLRCKPFIDQGEMEFYRWFPLKDLAKAYTETKCQAVYAPLMPHTFNKAKCLVAGTKIPTQEGIKNIEDISSMDYIWQETEFKPVSNIFKYKNQPVIKIKTQKGFEISGTYNHKLRSNGNFIELQDFKLSDVVDLSYFQFNSEKYQSISAPLLWTKKLDDINLSKLEEKNCPQIIINEDWGRLIGYIMGDGTVSSKNVVALAVSRKYKDVLNDFARIGNSIGVSPKFYSDDDTYMKFKKDRCAVYLNSRSLRWIFEHKFEFINKTTQEKNLKTPSVIWNSPKSVVKEYLRGLFETDGTVYSDQPTCELSTKSKTLAQEVQLLLTGFGIISSLKECYNKKYKKTYYKVSMGRQGCEQFSKEIGFISKLKREKLTQHCKKSHSNAYKEWEMQDFIVEITKDDNQDVFDIEVPENHYYIANGIVSHNSNIKYLEAACCGIPGVFQDLITYEMAPLRFTNGPELIDQLKYLLADQDRYMQFSKNAREYANTMWLDDHLDEHVELLFTRIGDPERQKLLVNNPDQASNITYENTILKNR